MRSGAATRGDVWLFDPASATLIAGDLVTLPVPFLDTACPGGWRVALAQLAATPFRRLIPGHGPVMTRADFALWRTAFAGFIDCTGTSGQCADGWVRAAGRLIPAPERPRARSMASYYADLLRKGSLARNCA